MSWFLVKDPETKMALLAGGTGLLEGGQALKELMPLACLSPDGQFELVFPLDDEDEAKARRLLEKVRRSKKGFTKWTKV